MRTGRHIAPQRVGLRRIAATALAVVWLVGCGYSFVTPGAHLPSGLRTVYVADIDDRSTDPELTDALERELRRILRSSGRFALASSHDAADAVLDVELVGTLSRPVAFDDLDEVLDYETTMRVDAVLRSREGEVLWEGRGIGATRAHAAVAGAVITSSSAFQSTERLTDEDLASYDTVQLGEQRAKHARDQLVGDLAGNIYTLMAEGR
jgi:outer membrane lipopolysaccharide assembly protein LptE/RlpB